MALHGTKALEKWCQIVTEDYDSVNILNMSTSWRNGLGFCAIIHHFRPELLDFDNLDPDDVYSNNELAFSVAEQHLGIPSLLDPQDMVECELIDRLSILTYLSQFYQAFHGSTAGQKSTSSKSSSAANSPIKSLANRPLPVVGRKNEPCKVCGNPVFILERLNVAGKLLHRTCFKCARCTAQLSIANYYETENGDYCCDVCPDEEVNQAKVAEANKKIVAELDVPDVKGADEASSDDSEDEDQPEGRKEGSQGSVEDKDGENSLPEDMQKNDEVGDDTNNNDKEDDVENNNEEDVEVVDKPECDRQSEDTLVEALETTNLQDDDGEDSNVKENDNDQVSDEEFKEVERKEDELKSIEYPDEMNPFGDEEEEEPAADVKPVSTNPFGSDFDDSEEESGNVTVKVTESSPAAPPKPPRAVSLNPFGSDFEDDDDDHVAASPALSTGSAPRRKKRQAPKPPGASPVPAPRTSLHSPRPSKPPPPRPPPPSADFSKSCKDRDNTNRRSQAIMETSSLSDASSIMSMSTTTSASTNTDSFKKSIVLTPMSPNKSSVDGQWKKKKGPAPPRPIPAKRQVKKLPRKAVNQELHDIEVKQQELERQGVKLEKTIRDLTNQNDAARSEAGLDNNDRDSLGPEAEDLMIQLFDLVNEKNDLFRRQTVLMYMKREQRLEEEHADIEHQIRILMAKPDALRTDNDKQKEDKLIERLMAIVSQRNEIVDCLEMDRVRALEEDESIEIHMEEYAAVKPPENDAQSKKKKKKKEKKKKKKNKDYDADKDIDTKEFPHLSSSTTSSPSKSSPLKKRLTLVSPLSGASSLSDKEKAKKLRKKIMSTLKPISSKKNANA